MSALVRMACMDDLAGVIELERGAAEAPHWSETQYVQIIRGVGLRRCLFVAELSGGVVGFAVGKVIAGLAELESIAVRADVRRSGVGRKLCEATAQWCRQEDSGAIELEVRATSVGAIALYVRLGFVEVGRRRSYYRDPNDDAVLMRLELV